MITRKELFSGADCYESDGRLICSTALFWMCVGPIMAVLLWLLVQIYSHIRIFQVRK